MHAPDVRGARRAAAASRQRFALETFANAPSAHRRRRTRPTRWAAPRRRRRARLRRRLVRRPRLWRTIGALAEPQIPIPRRDVRPGQRNGVGRGGQGEGDACGSECVCGPWDCAPPSLGRRKMSRGLVVLTRRPVALQRTLLARSSRARRTRWARRRPRQRCVAATALIRRAPLIPGLIRLSAGHRDGKGRGGEALHAVIARRGGKGTHRSRQAAAAFLRCTSNGRSAGRQTDSTDVHCVKSTNVQASRASSSEPFFGAVGVEAAAVSHRIARQRQPHGSVGALRRGLGTAVGAHWDRGVRR